MQTGRVTIHLFVIVLCVFIVRGQIRKSVAANELITQYYVRSYRNCIIITYIFC